MLTYAYAKPIRISPRPAHDTPPCQVASIAQSVCPAVATAHSVLEPTMAVSTAHAASPAAATAHSVLEPTMA
eukprot:4202162-Alexandrium_andersonii.AAC.1